MKASTSTRIRALQSVAFQPNYLVQRFFGDFIPWQYRDIALKRATDTNWMNAFRRAADRDSLSTPTWVLWPGTHQNLSYHKAALMLHTLERLHSWEVMQRVLSTFFTRWQVQASARRMIFLRCSNEVTGQDHAWFVEQVYRNSNTFDYGIERLAQRAHCVAGIESTRTAFEEPDARQAVPHHGRGAAARQRAISRRRAGDVQRRRPGARAVGRPRALAELHVRSSGAGGVGAGRSGARAAARHQLTPTTARRSSRRPIARPRSGRCGGWSGCRIC